MTLQKLGKHLGLYGRCFKGCESFKSWSEDLLVTSVHIRCLIAFLIFWSYDTLFSWSSEAAVLISIVQETARTVRQLHLYLPIWLVIEWKVSWGGWGGPVATFISHCPGLLNNFPLLCAISAPLHLLAVPVDDLCYAILVHRLGSPRREARLIQGKQHKSSDWWCGKVLSCMVIMWNHSLESIN